MSYSFSWDCTLPINNIQDIVSINIVPKTETFDEGDYLSLRGHICIEGEYSATTTEQHMFDEQIPLDITLPNHGQVEDILTEVINFDYEVKNSKILFLKVDLELLGYELEVETPLVDDVNYESNRDELEYETIDELDYSELEELVLDDSSSSVEIIENDHSEFDSELEKRKEIAPIVEKIKQNQVVETVVDTVTEVTEKLKPSHVAETVVDTVTDVTEKLKPSHVVETVVDTVTEVAEKLKPSHVVETITETVTGATDLVSEVVETIADKVIDSKVVEGVVKPFKPKEVTEVVVEEEVKPFPIKTEEVKVEKVSKEPTPSNLFDMLYDLDTKAVLNEETEYEVVSTQEIEKAEEVVEKIEEQPFYDDSIASQFADGASIIKIVFIQEEISIPNICEKYEVEEHAICNRDELESLLQCGDRVMINYGRVQ